MTAPVGYRRIRQTYGTVGTDWMAPSLDTFPGILSFAQVEHAVPMFKDGVGMPRGAFGDPELTWEFPPLSQTEYYQVMSLFTYIPDSYASAPVEVEEIDPQEPVAANKYVVWTGWALKPQRPDAWRNTADGHRVFGTRLVITSLKETE